MLMLTFFCVATFTQLALFAVMNWLKQTCRYSIGLVPLLLVLKISCLSVRPKFGGNKRLSNTLEQSNIIVFPEATTCDANKCLLPECRCGSTLAPDNLPLQEIPQIYMITFDDGVNGQNYDIYQRIFYNRTNPNGCPIRGTMFVSHEWTDYNLVQNLYYEGHEIASHTISHPQLGSDNLTDTLLEIDGQRHIIAKYANIPLSDIRGFRSPFLQLGGDVQYEALWRKGYSYDSSATVLQNDPPMWPYTFDYALPHPCNIPPCPTKSYPSLWEVPMVAWRDLSDSACSMVDACINSGTTVDEVYEFFMINFNRHYNSNRAPIGAWFHSAWFSAAEYRLEAFIKFVDDLTRRQDVWLVSAADTVEWMQAALPLTYIDKLEAWQCDWDNRISRKQTPLPQRCDEPNSCVTKFRYGEERNWKTCSTCPPGYSTHEQLVHNLNVLYNRGLIYTVYPWVGNPAGAAPEGGAEQQQQQDPKKRRLFGADPSLTS